MSNRPRWVAQMEKQQFYRKLIWDIYSEEQEPLFRTVRCIHCDLQMTFDAFTLDHLKPVTKGGKTDIWNLLPSCHPCNVQRGNTEDLSPKFIQTIKQAITKAFREKRVTSFNP
jgi:5-methylcytosine-specific restriction endonuclease McrA